MDSNRKSREYAAVNYCIYCGANNSSLLTDEHILPFSLGGRIVLPKATCLDCAKVTRGITETISRSIYGNLRVRLDIQSRRKKDRPKAFELTLDRPDGSQRKISVPASLWPRVYPVLVLKQAGIISGIAPDTYNVEICGEHHDVQVLYSKGLVEREEKVRFSSYFIARAFCRQPAQIAHAITVAEIGLDGYQPLLLNLIFDKNINSEVPFSLIGSVAPEEELENKIVLDLLPVRGVHYISCRFAMPNPGWKFPTYQIICGIVPDEASVRKNLTKTVFAQKA